MYTIKQNLVASENYSVKCPHSMTAEFIVVHNTANDATAENEVAYMIRNKNQVSFHYAVDDQEVVQGVPINRNTWHAGDGNGEGNRKGISIEICYSKSGGTRFDQAEKNAAHFIATLLRERGWGIEKVKKHQDFRNKYCPHRTLDKGWNGFIQMIKSYLNDIPVTSSSFKVGEKVRVKESATQYATGQALAWFVKGSIYEVTKVAGDQLLLSDIISWVWIDDVEKVSANTVIPKSYPFLVEIICDELNIRQKADFNSKVVGTVKRGEVYTITKEENGLGKLKSGVGYISMNPNYIKKK
ncbi:N-acetylmuramoyl-L-alanine amidase [Turicibacter bilis]|uniref:N-acetylmuramoyl-L-alanine amidase n=1 Tax=Turicibacter bilis TaxID=2735723 RepID=A0ABY5JHC9_9FIRM|nr:N-acetylmuramoyl-L-alanine amidase [Turicibacter bilis]MBS3199532.1 N-acetylmuramoyl-L-alanine amidase [Turicibacter bilis]UUF06102.1 N-acetylmuramoyl-L-alanine amidase [Turicibacter bilis]